MSEETLSDKIETVHRVLNKYQQDILHAIPKEDVREAVKKLIYILENMKSYYKGLQFTEKRTSEYMAEQTVNKIKEIFGKELCE